MIERREKSSRVTGLRTGLTRFLVAKSYRSEHLSSFAAALKKDTKVPNPHFFIKSNIRTEVGFALPVYPCFRENAW